MKITSRAAMQKFAAQIASPFLKGSTAKPGGISKNAKVIALAGELGAGKTTFTQGFLKALGVKSHVSSPTFLIIKSYKLPATNYPLAFHIDCYRLNHSSELFHLGFKEILKDPAHIVLIEWPELVKKYLPRDTRWITVRHGQKKNERVIIQRS